MRSYLIKLVLLFVNLLPNTRLYRLKVFIFNRLGFNVDITAHLISSVAVSGKCELHIGSYTFIGHDVSFYGNGGFHIGKNVDIGPRVCLLSGSHRIDKLPIRSAGSGYSDNIIIKDGAWIGAGSIILPGVTIGKCTIVAAGSVVTKDLADYSLYAGNPASFKKHLL